MKTKALFGIQFSRNNFYKDRLLLDFPRWKGAQHHVLTTQHNLMKLIIYKHVQKCDNGEAAGRPFSEVENEVMREIREELLEKGWQRTFDERLGDWQDFPRRVGCDIQKWEVEDLFKEDDCHQFYFTQTAINECNKLRVSEPLDLTWLRPVQDVKRQLNFGDRFIRYKKFGSKIIALSAAFTPRQESDYIKHTFFHFDLGEKRESGIIMHDSDYTDAYYGLCPKDFDKQSHNLLFQLITFLELAPIEQVYLPPGDRHSDGLSRSRLRNQEKFPIIMVNCNWNRTVHIGEIPVESHYRLQPWGPGSKLRKVILIPSHSREGYNIKAHKLRQVQV